MRTDPEVAASRFRARGLDTPTLRVPKCGSVRACRLVFGACEIRSLEHPAAYVSEVTITAIDSHSRPSRNLDLGPLEAYRDTEPEVDVYGHSESELEGLDDELDDGPNPYSPLRRLRQDQRNELNRWSFDLLEAALSLRLAIALNELRTIDERLGLLQRLADTRPEIPRTRR